MVLYIKNMVSLRCKISVTKELAKMGLAYSSVEMGMVQLITKITVSQRGCLRENLSASGLELLDDRKSILIEQIKNVIIELVHYTDELPKTNYSEYISRRIGYDYTYLSNLFSEAKGIDIQHFIIKHKIERVKELIQYKELNLTEISYKLHYSSVSHLSNQFKKVTGLSPSTYRQQSQKRWNTLENM
ncbi:helix-turn-helix domain-containing protein [Dyadobacter frigoris]|uniref:Helix-turn-helix transcriptional regulator n=1 Tax=Dyadobacter frigoris TaxID=2576211 RepID=A0A4U6CSM0_9BACT|nr:AraC family transcriptional regulator [Dyadobacter frigoris]TKT86511.1 helix-turn-helix transcriptional regulator [Dyadobacter frigoris]